MERRVVELRTVKKWGPDRIAGFLADAGDGEVKVSPATVWRILQRRGISRLRDLDIPTGESKRDPRRYEHERPGDMAHVDVKKVGRIPDGGGWFVHGRDSAETRASHRVANHRAGYAYIHAAVDDHTRLAYAEVHDNERKETASAFWLRAVEFYRAHGIEHIARCLTDNGPAYRSKEFNETLAATSTVHKYTRPHTPRTNGKVERFNLTMKNEWLYVRPYTSDADRTEALAAFLNEYNYERPHSSLGNKPPASRVPVATFRMQPQPVELEPLPMPNPEPTLFDFPSTTS